MKKLATVVTALVLAFAISATVQAGNRMGGMKGGCGDCGLDGSAPPSEQLRKFQADTIDLRQEMMLKRFEVQRENLKATPDNAKIDALRTEIKTIQAKIMDIRTQSGLPVKKMRDGGCGPRGGKGGCGDGQMGGCNGAPCGSR